MSTRDAYKALVAAGKRADAHKVIADKTRSVQNQYNEIRQDRSRTEDYKKHLFANSYLAARRSIDEELNRLASRVIQIDRDDASNVFGTAGLPGDPASLSISLRDASDRVAGIQEGKDLRELLARATRSGDEVLARACVQRAMEMQSAETVNAFTADRPGLEAATERLWNSQQAEHDSFSLTMELIAMQPGELSGMGHDAIEAAAAQPENAA